MGCILQFFRDIHDCIDNVNAYKIGVDEIEHKFPLPTTKGEQTKSLPQHIEDQARQYIANARATIMRTYTQLQGVSEIIKGFDMENINKLYTQILESNTPDPKICQEYVQLVYKGFVTSILKDMLRNVEIYSELIKE